MTNRQRYMKAAKKKEDHDRMDWKALVVACRNRCVKCGSAKFGRDHITPIALGGSNGISNVQPLCWPCNRDKRMKDADYRPAIVHRDYPVVHRALTVAEHLEFSAMCGPKHNSLDHYANEIMTAIRDAMARTRKSHARIKRAIQLGRGAARRTARRMAKAARAIGNI